MATKTCQQCHQPLEEWEAGLRDGCGTRKPHIECQCGERFTFLGPVNKSYKCPRCGKACNPKPEIRKC